MIELALSSFVLAFFISLHGFGHTLVMFGSVAFEFADLALVAALVV